jgi:hypothetical protein
MDEKRETSENRPIFNVRNLQRILKPANTWESINSNKCNYKHEKFKYHQVLGLNLDFFKFLLVEVVLSKFSSFVRAVDYFELFVFPYKVRFLLCELY